MADFANLKCNHFELFIGMGCNLSCSHCMYGCSPKMNKYSMSELEIEWSIDNFVKYGASSMGIMGGEPFLYFDKLVHAVKTAAKHGIQEIDIVSNASWAKDEGSASELLIDLKLAKGDSNLSLAFSYDTFHQKNVPIKHVANAINVSEYLGLPYKLNLLYGDNHVQEMLEEIIILVVNPKIPYHATDFKLIGRASDFVLSGECKEIAPFSNKILKIRNSKNADAFTIMVYPDNYFGIHCEMGVGRLTFKYPAGPGWFDKMIPVLNADAAVQFIYSDDVELAPRFYGDKYGAFDYEVLFSECHYCGYLLNKFYPRSDGFKLPPFLEACNHIPKPFMEEIKSGSLPLVKQNGGFQDMPGLFYAPEGGVSFETEILKPDHEENIE